MIHMNTFKGEKKSFNFFFFGFTLFGMFFFFFVMVLALNFVRKVGEKKKRILAGKKKGEERGIAKKTRAVHMWVDINQKLS